MLGPWTSKIISNGVNLNKKNGLAMPRGIESGPLVRKMIKFFKTKK